MIEHSLSDRAWLRGLSIGYLATLLSVGSMLRFFMYFNQKKIIILTKKIINYNFEIELR